MEKGQYPYQKGEYVIYRSTGLCRIVDIREERFGDAPARTYYVIHPADQPASQFFVPTDLPTLEQNMRPLLSSAQIHQMIRTAYREMPAWIEDAKQRAAAFEAVLRRGDRTQLLRMIRLLRWRQSDLEAQHKKLYASDTRVLQNAQRILTQELAFVLHIGADEVIPYVLEHRPQTV